MDLFMQVRRAVKEMALVLTADVDTELMEVRRITDICSAASHYVSAQQAVYKDKLAEHHCCEAKERAAVEAAEEQLQSRQQLQEYQQPIHDFEQRVSDMSANIIAVRSENESLEAENHKLQAMGSDDELSHKKIEDRKWKDLDMYQQMTKLQWNYELEPPEISGYITQEDDVSTFQMSTNQNSRFFIANKLWNAMSQ